MEILGWSCWVDYMNIHVIAINHIFLAIAQLLNEYCTRLQTDIMRKIQTHILHDLSQTCRNRSMRQDECSGPMPSIPWGNNITRPLCNNHFAKSEEYQLEVSIGTTVLFLSPVTLLCVRCLPYCIVCLMLM